MSKTLDVLNAVGIPFAYDHFAEGEGPSAPFCVYRYPATDNFIADGIVYYSINEVNIELYTDAKEPALEQKIEEALTSEGIAFRKDEIWIREERLYEVIYDYEEESVDDAEEE